MLGEDELGAELEDAGGELVGGGEGGDVGGEDGGIPVLVEGVVDVDQFWLRESG